MADRNITYGINFQANTAGLKQVQKDLAQIQQLSAQSLSKENIGIGSDELNAIKSRAGEVQKALTQAFDPKTGALNLRTFNKELSNVGLSYDKIYQDFSKLGSTGNQAFVNLTGQVLKTNTALKQSSALADKLFTSLKNIAVYQGMTALFQGVVGQVSQATSYIRNLDESLNNIRIVTKQSADEMDAFAEKANVAAQAIGQTTTAFTDAALIYVQQGLGEEQASALAETTLKIANVTKQSAETVSEEVTAIMNGYQLLAEGTDAVEGAMDKLAAVAATSASNLAELASGMSKVASAANSMGVDIDQLTAQMSTIISVTRQAPESVGTALKTIYARLGDLKIDGVDEFGTTLGEVSGQLAKIGIQVTDATGNLRPMGVVMEEIADKWNTWTEAQRQAAAVAMAGKRQYNNLIALFDNWDHYTKELNVSQTAFGEINKQNAIYLDSVEAKEKQLKATSQELFGDLLNADTLKGFTEGLTTIVSQIDKVVKTIGGGSGAIINLAAVLTSLFSKNLGNEITRIISNFQAWKNNAIELKEQLSTIKDLATMSGVGSEAAQGMIQRKQDFQMYQGVVSNETIEQFDTLNLKIGETEQKLADLHTKIDLGKEIVAGFTGSAETDFTSIGDALGNLTRVAGNDVVKITADVKNFFNKIKEDSTNINNASESLVDSLDGVKHVLDSLTKNNWPDPNAPKEVQNMGKAYDNACNAMRQYESLVQQGVQDQNQLTNAARQVDNALNQLDQSFTNAFNSEPVQALINDVYESYTEVQQLEAQVRSLQNELARVQEQSKNAFIGNNISNSIALISQMAMVLSNISGIWDTLADKELSGVEKFERVLSASVMTGTMVVPLLMKLIKARNTYIATLKTQQATEWALQKLQEYGHIPIGKTIAGLTAEEKALVADIAAKKADTLATKELTGSMLALNALPIIAVITAIVGAFVALGKALENDRQASEDFYREQKEHAQTINEEIQANQELYNSYKETYEIFKETGDKKEELRQQTIELAEKYGIESAAVRALAGDYANLNKEIEAKRKQDLEDQITNAKQGYNAASQEALHSARKDAGRLVGNNYTFDANAGITNLDELNAIQIALDNSSAKLNSSGSISFNFDASEPKNIIKYYEEINNLLDIYSNKLETNEYQNSEIVQSLKDEAAQMREAYEAAKEFAQVMADANVELAVMNNTEELTTASSINDILTARKNIIQELQSLADEGEIDLTSEEITTMADEAIKSIDAVEDRALDFELGKILQKELGDSIEDIDKTIADFSEDQKNFLLLHLDIKPAQDSLNKFLKDFESFINFANKKGDIQLAENALNNFDSKKGFKQEDISAMYQDPNMAANIGMTETQFSEADADEQLNAIANYVIQSKKLFEEEKEAAIKETQEKIQAIKEANSKLKESAEDASDDFTKAIDNTSKALESGKKISEKYKDALEGLEQSDIVDIFRKMADGAEELTEKEEKAKDAILKFGDVSEDSLTDGAKAIGEYAEQVEELDSLEATLREIEEGSYSAAEGAQRLHEVLIQQSSSIDNIQAAYKTLSGVVDEYNSTGAWTIDMVQSLIDMDDQYVATLDFTGQGLQLNEAAWRALTLAKYDELQASIDAEYQENLLALAERAEAAAAEAAKIANDSNTESINNTGAAAENNIDPVLRFTQALAQMNAEMRSSFEDEKADLDKAYENRKKALEEGRKELEKTGSSFRSAMGAPAKSSGGGSKKGGSSKPKTEKAKEEKVEEPDHMDPFEDSDLEGTKRLFRGIDAELERIAGTLEHISRNQEHLVGSALVRNLNKQVKIMKEQVQLYQEKLKIAKQERDITKEQLAAQGAEFGPHGSIMNATQLLQKKADGINKMIDAYNGMSKAQQDAYKKEIDDAEKSYNNFKKTIEYYEELQQTITDVKSQIDSLKDSIRQAKIEKFNAKIDLSIRWNDWQASMNDFKKEMIEFNNKYGTIYIDVDTGNVKEAVSYLKDYGSVIEANRVAEGRAAQERKVANKEYNRALKELRDPTQRKKLNKTTDYNLNTKKGRKKYRKDLRVEKNQTLAAIDENLEIARANNEKAFQDALALRGDNEQYRQMLEQRQKIEAEYAQKRAELTVKRDEDLAAARKKNGKEANKELAEEYGIEDLYKKNDKVNNQFLRATIVDSWADAMQEVSDMEHQQIQQLLNDYINAIDSVEEHSTKATKKAFEQQEALMEASFSRINEIIAGNGKRSILGDAIEQAEKVTARLVNMADNASKDNKGNVVYHGDKLKIGGTNPVTGEKIENKEDLEAAREQAKETGIGGNKNLFGNWVNDLLENGEKAKETLTNIAEQLTSEIEALEAAYQSMVDEILANSEKILNNYELINTLLDDQVSIYRLIGMSQDEINDIQQQQVNNKKEMMEFNKDEIERYRKLRDEQKEGTEERQKFEEKYQEAVSAYYESQLDYLEAVRSQMEEAINQAIDAYDKATSLGLGISELSTQWTEAKEMSALYLNNIDKALAIQELQAKYQEAINNEDNVTRQAQLRDIMEQQVEQLRQAEYLSQAEVDNANALYDVTVKQIALEEAQRNKSKMRLRRDSQGNYTYQYTADQNDVKNKQNDLNNSIKNLVKTTEKGYEQNLDNIIKVRQDYQSRISELTQQRNAEGATDEDKARIDAIIEKETEDFNKKLDILQSQNTNLQDQYIASAGIAVTAMAETMGVKELSKNMGLTQEQTANIESFVNTITNGGTQGILDILGKDSSSGLAGIVSGANKNAGDIISGIINPALEGNSLPQQLINNKEAIETETSTLNATLSSINTKWDTFQTEWRKKWTNEERAALKKVISDAQSDISDIKTLLDDETDGLAANREKIEAAIGVASAALERIETALDPLNDAVQAIMEETVKDTYLTLNKHGEAKIKTFKFENGQMVEADKKIDKKIEKALANDEWIAEGKQKVVDGISYTKITTQSGASAWVKTRRLSNTSQAQILEKYLKETEGFNDEQLAAYHREHSRDIKRDIQGVTSRNEFIRFIKANRAEEDAATFATGGYTGDWDGNQGKLAFLHKKEQVFNADDTQKILDAAMLANAVASQIAQFGIANNDAVIRSIKGLSMSNSETLDQEVHITATFPNVSDHSEIEQALNNLINRASQYAGRSI